MIQDAKKQRWAGAGLQVNCTYFVAAILLLAFAIRIRCLDCQSLWLDEAASAYWTGVSPDELFLDTADNLHVPGYFLALRAWVALAGISAFSLRYFSLIGGLLLIPAAYWFARHAFGGRASALLAALIAALSPAHIYYSQETRMYALLPTFYLFMLALVLSIARQPRRLHWLLLAIVEVLVLYLHLFAGLMVIAVNLLLAFAFIRRPQPRSYLMHWIGSQVLVALALAPWIWFTWRSGGALPANLGDTSGGVATFALEAYLQQVWSFLITGLTGVRSFLVYWSVLIAVILLAGVALSYATTSLRRRRALFASFLAFALPLLFGALVWLYNPLTHPRYLLFLLGPLVVLLGQALAAMSDQRRIAPVAVAALALIIVTDIAALHAAQMDAGQRRYDASALAESIARRGGPRAIVLMPPFDRSLLYYDPAPVQAANWPFAGGQQDQRISRLERLLEGYQSAFLVEYHDLYSYDPHHQLPFLLEANGHLLEQFTVDRMDVSHYAIDSDWSAPQFRPLDLPCGPLRLTGAYFPEAAAPGDAPAVALRWQLLEAIDESFSVSARLMDGEQQLAGADRPLIEANGAQTGSWSVGDEATTYFILPFPLGTPPLAYDLGVVVYPQDGDPLPCGDGENHAQHVGQIALSSADRRTADAYGTWSEAIWRTPISSSIAAGITLEGYSIRPPVLPARPAHVTLRWRAAEGERRPADPTLLLQDNATLLESAGGDLFQRYPTTRWREGELFIETRQLTMPVTLEPLELAIEEGNRIQPLGQIRVDLSALQWTVPVQATEICASFQDVGTLRGYMWEVDYLDDNEAQVVDDDHLTLFWEAGENAPTATSYTVFAHLLAPDGRIVVQDDGLPAEGERPTNGWLPREVIADEHQFDLPEDIPDDSWFSVGLYNLVTLERVPAFDCDGQRLRDDALIISIPELE